MLVKCIKYINLFDEIIETSNSIEKGELYPVLSLYIDSINHEVNYYIQARQNNDFRPFWADAKQFEIIDPIVYSDWAMKVEFYEDQTITFFTPRAWYENESWFVEEIVDETPRAVELFTQERDKICMEMEQRGIKLRSF